MEIDLSDISASFRDAHAVRYSRHDVLDRLKPSILQYDYLSLHALATDVERLIAEVPAPVGTPSPIALDIGCGKSPYRDVLESRGFLVKTMDIDDTASPDYVGSIEYTSLTDSFADLVICTQVLEHSLDPDKGVQEIFRILRPGGYLVASAPHIWFYHPHPTDNWRFTQEGLTRIVNAAGFEPTRLLSQGGSVMALFQIVNFLLFGTAGKLGTPFYVVNNLIGRIADRLLANLYSASISQFWRENPEWKGFASF
jgi:2-polyprenyl-3-methyl-5-hydroxy-6-metoxy-1,4-benzoquinol methylase